MTTVSPTKQIDIVDLTLSDSDESTRPKPPSSRLHSKADPVLTNKKPSEVSTKIRTLQLDHRPAKRQRTASPLFVDEAPSPSASPQTHKNRDSSPNSLFDETTSSNHDVDTPDTDPPTPKQYADAPEILTKRLQQLRDDTVYTTRVFLRRARLSAIPQAQDTLDKNAADAFAKLRPISTVTAATDSFKKVTAKSKTKKLEEVDGTLLQTEHWKGATKLPTKPSRRALNVASIEHDLTPEHKTPKYSHVVRIHENVLAPNIPTLTRWPYFSDEQEIADDTFADEYFVDFAARPAKLDRLQRARWLKDACHVALQDAKLEWSDVLHYLFCDKDQLKMVLGPKADTDREEIIDDEFPIKASRWLICAAEKGTNNHLPGTAAFCRAFYNATGDSIWQILRRSSLIKEYFADPDDIVDEFDERECRICYRFGCNVHGSIVQYKSDLGDDGSKTEDSIDLSSPRSRANRRASQGQGGEGDDEEDIDDIDATDIVNPPKSNFRRTLKFEPPNSKEATVLTKWKTRSHWEARKFQKVNEAKTYFPCSHPGKTCAEAECACVTQNRTCEKFCTCAADCPIKFQGCNCLLTKPRKPGEFVCFKDDRCTCYQEGRECDPDLCGKCGVIDALVPTTSDHDLARCCRNANIQRGRPRHTILGDSLIHELGLFACETIMPEDFIGEYIGESLTFNEAERRGAIYSYQGLSYLFTLGAEQNIDSTFCGNKIRFINHNASSARNVYATVSLVNTVLRIGLYAEKKIEPGEELFFDYGSAFPEEQLGIKKVIKGTPATAGLVKEFANPTKDDIKTQIDVKSQHRATAKGVARPVDHAGKGRS